MRQNRSTEKKVFYTALVFCAVVLGVYGFVFVGILSENRDLAELSTMVDSKTKEKAFLSTLKDKLAATVDARIKLEKQFIGKDSVVSFLNYIQGLGEDNFLDVKIDNVSLGESPLSKDFFETVVMRVTALGEWADVRRFVSLLDVLPYKIIIDAVDVRKGVSDEGSNGQVKKKSQSGFWTGTFEIRALKFK